MPDRAGSRGFEHILVTARALASRPLLEQLGRVLGSERNILLPRPQRIILREKDLSDAEYAQLAQEISTHCERENVIFIWQSHVGACPSDMQHIQMGMSDFLNMKATGEAQKHIECWVSVHSVEEALVAEQLGATAVIYGHVYETDCKFGVEPRGLEALEEVIKACNIPVYAIGGIYGEEQFRELAKLGCAGACIMSSYMKS